MIYNVLVSGVQQSDSVIYIYLFHILFHYSLLKDIVCNSLAIQEDFIVYFIRSSVFLLIPNS